MLAGESNRQSIVWSAYPTRPIGSRELLAESASLTFDRKRPMSNNSDIEFLLTESRLDQLIDQWLAEDIPSFDYGAAVVGSRQNQAHLYCKSPGVLAGIPFVNQILTKRMDCSIEWLVKEGTCSFGQDSKYLII